MQSVAVDTGRTFTMLALMSCEAKTGFGSDKQERTKAGIPKWDLQIVAGYVDGFGKAASEIIKVGVTAEHNPADGIAPLTPVELVGLEMGVMDKETRDRDTGVRQLAGAQTWFRAQAVRPFNGHANGNGRAKQEQPAAA